MKDWSRIVDMLLPARCAGCGDRSGKTANLCDLCRQDLPWLLQACRYCAMPLAGRTQVCGVCTLSPPRHRCRAALEYRGLARELVVAMKFHDASWAALSLAQIMCDSGPEALPGSEYLLLPMPSERRRLKSRGFNPAAELASCLASQLELQVCHSIVVRKGVQPAQTTLRDPLARRRNVHGIFTLRQASPPRIVIIDDVLTTGASTAELARTLFDGGAEEVLVWAACRA